jgi:hypothetical protein
VTPTWTSTLAPWPVFVVDGRAKARVRWAGGVWACLARCSDLSEGTSEF